MTRSEYGTRHSILARWRPALLWAGLILVLTTAPLPSAPGASAGLPVDKLVHGLLYAVLGWLVMRAYRLGAWSLGSAVAAAGVTVLLFGAGDELHQLLLHWRSPSLADWGADSIGGSIGVLAATWREPRGP